MSDIATVWDVAHARGDFVMNGTQPASGGDLGTAMLISLFSDRLAEPDDVIPDGTNDPRGCWFDAGETYKCGSRMWLLDRSKQTPDILQRAKSYIVEALQWLIDDGVVKRFDITTAFAPQQLSAQVVAFRSNGQSVAENFSWVWGTLVPNSGSWSK